VLLLTVFVVVLAATTNAQKVSYHGHQVWRFPLPAGPLRELLAQHIHLLKLDLWAEHPAWVDVRIPPQLQSAIHALSIPYSVMIEDLEADIAQERLQKLQISQTVGADITFFNTYRTYDEFNVFTTELANSYPTLVTKHTIGRTVEQRAINAITITSIKNRDNKVGIVYNGGQHAREWIGPMTNAYIAYQLVSRYGTDPKITEFLDEIEWTIIPIVNCDGYIYSWVTDRMWRKNRRYNENSWFDCYGVDNNRNWDEHWGGEGASTDTCSETYRGPNAFSEPEEVAVAEFILKRGNVAGYIDFHSYSQLWLLPWGWTAQRPADYTEMMAAARQSVDALEAVYGTVYEYGPSYTTIYPASGGSNDWTYGAANVTLSFVVELRDTGRYGFILPANQIVPTGTETMAGVEAMATFILNQKK